MAPAQAICGIGSATAPRRAGCHRKDSPRTTGLGEARRRPLNLIHPFPAAHAKPFLRQIQEEFENNEELKAIYPDVLWQHPRRQAPLWSRVVGVRSRRSSGDVDVFLKVPGNNQLGGVVVIVAEPRELTFVNVVGTISPEDVADLSGEFHIPKLHAKSSTRERDDK